MRRPTIIGCQGCVGLRPENTLAAVAHTSELGADGSEIDVHVLSDGIVVAHHNYDLCPDITRDHEGRWIDDATLSLSGMSFAALRSYDVGRARAEGPTIQRYPDQRACDGQAIPTLSQMLTLHEALGDRRSHLWVEIKNEIFAEDDRSLPIARAVCSVLERHDALRRVTVIAFDWRILRACAALHPGIPTGYLTVDPRRLAAADPSATGGATEARLSAANRPWFAGFDPRDHGGYPQAVKAAGGVYWSPHHGDLDASSLDAARRSDLRVSVWGADTRDDIARAVDLGVDSLTTARPDWALEILAERHFAS